MTEGSKLSKPPPRASLRPGVMPRTVLVVDDDDAVRNLTSRYLRQSGMEVLEAHSGESAVELAVANAGQLDVIVLDVMMPGINGFETLTRLKANAVTSTVPVILLTAHANEDVDVVRSADAGAIDHLAKPYRGAILVAKVNAAAKASRQARELQKKLVRAEENATIDPLTRLGNRRHFEARLAEEASFAKRHHAPLALLMIDLDHFKAINDRFGHEDGDRVLEHVAELVRTILRKEDSAFRYGGEEIVVLFRATPVDAALAIAERLRATLRAAPIELGHDAASIPVTFSGGIASADAATEDAVDKLVAHADAALYRAKRGGRDRVELATPGDAPKAR